MLFNVDVNDFYVKCFNFMFMFYVNREKLPTF